MRTAILATVLAAATAAAADAQTASRVIRQIDLSCAHCHQMT